MHRIYYRHLVGVTHTEAQAKKEAGQIMVVDGPNDLGEWFQRPGRLTDHFPSPYSNEQEARASNNGAYPPDLSLITNGRYQHGTGPAGGMDYIFSILTGFQEETPAGHNLMEGQYFNPWFPGTAISMAPPLMDGSVDYPDGTVATTSQMAKDVVMFLHWCSEPYYETKKFWVIPVYATLFLWWAAAGYHTRYFWNIFRTQKIRWKQGPPPR